MSENTTQEKGLFETLEEHTPEVHIQANSKFENCEEEFKFEFLVQDMFLDHFFP